MMTFKKAFKNDLAPIAPGLTAPHRRSMSVLGGCIAFIDAGSCLTAVPFLGTYQQNGKVVDSLHHDSHSLIRAFATKYGMSNYRDASGRYGIDTYSWNADGESPGTYAKTWENYPKLEQPRQLDAICALSQEIPELELCFPTSPTTWLRIKESQFTRIEQSETNLALLT